VANLSKPLVLSFSPGSNLAAGEIAKELDAVGFNVKAVQYSNLDNLVTAALGGQTDMYLLTYTSNTLDGLDILSSLLQNNQNYDNPQIDSLSTQASNTLDPATRISILQKIAVLAADNEPVIPLYSADDIYTVNKSYVVTADLPSEDAGVLFWKVYQN